MICFKRSQVPGRKLRLGPGAIGFNLSQIWARRQIRGFASMHWMHGFERIIFKYFFTSIIHVYMYRERVMCVCVCNSKYEHKYQYGGYQYKGVETKTGTGDEEAAFETPTSHFERSITHLQ